MVLWAVVAGIRVWVQIDAGLLLLRLGNVFSSIGPLNSIALQRDTSCKFAYTAYARMYNTNRHVHTYAHTVRSGREVMPAR
jgi:hypothetical protein